MDSRENKIIDLAQSLLQEQKNGLQTRKHSNRRATWRSSSSADTVAVLDTFLKHAKSTVTMIANNRPANRYECVEIEALFFYTAREGNVELDELRTSVCTDLKVSSLDELTVSDYTKIRDYLWAQAS